MIHPKQATPPKQVIQPKTRRVKEVMVILGIGRDRLRELEKSGELVPLARQHFHSPKLYLVADCDAYLERMRQRPRPRTPGHCLT